jgi:hypothetical protein
MQNEELHHDFGSSWLSGFAAIGQGHDSLLRAFLGHSSASIFDGSSAF